MARRQGAGRARSSRNRWPAGRGKRTAGVQPGGPPHPRSIPDPSLVSDMSATDMHPPAQETRPPSLVFQLLSTAHSVTDRLTQALVELGLSPAGLDLLTQLA